MWTGALGAQHGLMLTQYATAVAAEDRIRRRHDEAADARRGRTAPSPSKRHHRWPLRAVAAGMTARIVSPVRLAGKGVQSKLDQEVHTAC
jgi:hypothetical protein